MWDNIIGFIIWGILLGTIFTFLFFLIMFCVALYKLLKKENEKQKLEKLNE